MSKVRVSVLPNGLRIVSDHMPWVETVSVGVWVDVGTRHEAPEVHGVSHLLEHMAFKGTRRRGARDIAEEIEAVGGSMNAYTSRENTAYYAKVLKENVGLAVDILADILQHSMLDAEELERERAVVLQEIHQACDTPDDIVFDMFQETAFPDQPLGRPVLGTAERIGVLERQLLIDYMRGNYSAPRLVVSAAGNVNHDALTEMVGRAFDDLPIGDAPPVHPARYLGGESRRQRDLEQVHLVFGFDGVPYGDPAYYDVAVLSALLGGGMSSRLFQEAREKRGLVYSIYSFSSNYIDGGLFGIYAGTGPDEVSDLMPVVCGEITAVRDSVRDDEVARAVAQIKAGALMTLESTSSRCEQLARQLLVFGRPLPAAEIVAKVEAVTPDTVLAAARRVFTGQPVLAVIGNLKGVEPLERIRSRLG